MTRVELKTFTLASGSKSVSIDNCGLGHLPKRILFTMIKNSDFAGSIDCNPYKFQHYDLSSFALFVNGKHIRKEGFTLGMDHEKASVLAYRTFFEGSGIHHSSASHQITHDMYIAGYFMLLFDLTPDQGASEGHTSHMGSGIIRVKLKFNKSLPASFTCLLYLEFYVSIRVDNQRVVTTDF